MNKNSFKQILLKNSVLALGFVAISSSLYANDDINLRQAERVIVELDNAFIPSDGFDDNDNIQVVIEGYLPNSCYTLAQANTALDQSTRTLVVQQQAMKATRGVCADGAELPPDLAAPVYFWKVLDVGSLQSGRYQLSYNAIGERMFKDFRVQFSPTEEIDNMRYVQVDNAFAEAAVPSTSGEFEIRITGQLTSSCAVLKDDAVVVQVGDVIVVLLETERTADFCMPTSHPFYKVIKAKTPSVGRYLLHVRSIGGQSKNKIFSVVQ